MCSFCRMPIDKSWIGKSRNTLEYAEGLRKFLNFAFQHRSIDGHVIKCPCLKCGFRKWKTRDVVREHLTCNPFPVNYKVWYWHGEEESNVTNSDIYESTPVIEENLHRQNVMETMINDAFGLVGRIVNEHGIVNEPSHREITL